MIAFLFPIVFGALIGFTFDDGNIDKSDFVFVKKQIVKAYKDADFSAIDTIKI